MKNIVNELKNMESRIVEIKKLLLTNDEVTDFDGDIIDSLEAIKFALEDLEESVFEYE